MRRTATSVTVRWRSPGWHRWPDATGERSYLAARHRHLFHCEATLPVGHDNREVEFHDLLDVCRAATPGGAEWGDASCETIAEHVAGRVLERWPGRTVTVAVFEDGECGASITVQAEV